MKSTAADFVGDAVVRWGWVIQTVVKVGFAVYLLLGVTAILAL
jgi:hypothetical protein